MGGERFTTRVTGPHRTRAGPAQRAKVKPSPTGLAFAAAAGPGAERRAVDMLKEVLGMSERLACKAVGLARSTYRRLPVAVTPADPDADLRQLLRELLDQTSLPRVWPCVGGAAR